MKAHLTFGPYFTATPADTGTIAQRVEPLGLACEWAGPNTGATLNLFRYRPPHAPNHCRPEQVVFRADQLPFQLECPEFQVIESAGATFLPLEVLLVQLYRTWQVGQHIFTVLDELVSRVPLHSSVTRSVIQTGLLVPSAEAQGFRLNTVLCTADQLFAEIGWQPRHQPSLRFHVGLCRFESGDLNPGHWQPPDLLGVSQLLAEQLHLLVPGNPSSLFSPAGQRFLTAHLPQVPAQR